MTPAAFVVQTGHRTRDTDGFLPDSHTLAGEHTLLMRDVRRRAASVIALLEARVWPHAEVGTLTNFLRATVLRQASDEEALLYPHGPSAAPFAELTADHVRLHSLTARLEDTRTQPCPLPELRALVDDLLATLERHLADERAVLAALSDPGAQVPSAADLAAGDQAWTHADDGPVLIMLDALPDEHAMRLCVERLLRLRPGQVAEVHSRDGWRISQVCRWMRAFDSTRYACSHPSPDEGDTPLRVTRRRAD